MHIFVAGFQHETNTFAPSKADWPAFVSGSAFPAFSVGAEMLDRLAGTSLPMGGFIRSARQRGWTLLPSAWAGASPSAHVTREAFERIAEQVVSDARQGGFDAVYLDLHGAAVAEHVDDAEGELLQRLRAVVGGEMPLVASLDLHANVTRRMLQHTSAMSAYRTYPHVDGADTGARCAELLAEMAAAPRQRWATHQVRLPFLLPLNAQCTMMEPAAGVYRRLGERDRDSGTRLSFAMGFPAADFDECGPVVFGHGRDAAAVEKAVQAVADDVLALRSQWKLELYSPDEAVRHALQLSTTADKPVVIADTQDNPGAGADSNTTGMLHALRRCGAGERWPGRVALGLMFDPAAARQAHAAGVGATLDMPLGTAVPTFTGQPSDPPVQGRFKVLSLSDGVVPMHGPMTAGGTAHLGLSAGLEIDGIRVNVVSGQCQMLDLDLFRFLGVEPEAMKLLVNKSSVHFRAAFAPIASHILVAVAPGPMAADPAALPWKNLPTGLALSLEPARPYDERNRTMSRVWFSRGLRGMLARRIQSDLLRAGFTSGPIDKFVDGDFGGHTETALKALQARRGLAVNGTVDVETWQQLTTEPLPTLYERCLGITAQFEGHGFGLLQGNFDGAGLTWGIIGFTLKSQQIQALLAETEAAMPGTLARVLGPLAPVWQRMVQKPLAEQIAWADSISSGPSHSTVPREWRDAFARLGDEPIVKRLQMQRAYDKYFVPCARSARQLGLRSELGIELAFDVHVQNGSFKPAAFALAASLPANTPEIERRRRLANAVADSANPRWVEDVRERKLALANGQGSVHGRGYSLGGWGLSEVAAA